MGIVKTELNFEYKLLCYCIFTHLFSLKKIEGKIKIWCYIHTIFSYRAFIYLLKAKSLVAKQLLGEYFQRSFTFQNRETSGYENANNT